MFRFLFKLLFGGTDDPSVDWSEIDSLRVVARETASDGYYRRPVEQVLCESGDDFVLYTRVGDGLFLARTTLRRPLQPDQTLIQRFQPDARSYGLQLAAAGGRTAAETVCRRTWFGLWKDAGMDGFAFFTQLQSDDFARLEQFRGRILPGPVPESVLAQEKWNARLEGMSEGERRVAFAQMMLEGTRRVDELVAARHGDLGPPPAELAGLIQGVEQRKAQMLADLQQRAGDRPLDPDMVRMLEATMKRTEQALQQQADADRE